MNLLLLILLIVFLVALNIGLEPMENSNLGVVEPSLENCVKLAKEACRTPILNGHDSFLNQYTFCDKIHPRKHQLLGSYSQCTNNMMTPLKCGDGDRETCFPEERVSEVCSADIFNKCMSTVPRNSKDKYIIKWKTHCK